MVVACVLAAAGTLGASQFGTGFAISPKGYIVTCHHVVRHAEQILVHTRQGTLQAKTVAIDPRNDLAILKVDNWDGSFLGLIRSHEVGYATEVTAVGFPDPTILGRNPKISKGIISALSGIRDDPRYLQTSTPIQPGNSGGPLIGPSGQVIGIIAAGLNSLDRISQGGYLPQSVNFAVKSDLVFPLLENASIRLPWFPTRTRNPGRQVERALGSIALIEASSPRLSFQPHPPGSHASLHALPPQSPPPPPGQPYRRSPAHPAPAGLFSFLLPSSSES